jgi:hypothetical protein
MENLIVFRAYNSKRQMPIKLSPLEDKTGKLFTGQGKYGYYDLLTEEEKRNLPYVVNHETVITIKTGDILNLKDPVDATNWEWIKKHPYIALDEEEGRGSRDVVMYIDNPEKKAEMHVVKDKKITMAKAKIYSASNAKKTQLCKALGNPGADTLSINMLEDWLILQAETMYEQITKLLDDKNKTLLNYKIFIEELKQHNLIINHIGVWKYGGKDGVVMGSDEDEIIKYLSDKKNQDEVFIMKEKIKELKG